MFLLRSPFLVSYALSEYVIGMTRMTTLPLVSRAAAWRANSSSVSGW